MLDLLLIPIQALFVAFCAAGATAVFVGTWPTPAGAFGVFLLYCVVGVFLHFLLSLGQSTTLLGRWDYDQIFFVVFGAAVMWTQTELLKPEGYPRMNFTQASWILMACGFAFFAFDSVFIGKLDTGRAAQEGRQ